MIPVITHAYNHRNIELCNTITAALFSRSPHAQPVQLSPMVQMFGAFKHALAIWPHLCR